MKINEKDRSQLLRMAGNIACGFTSGANPFDVTDEWGNAVADLSAGLALKTLLSVDKLIVDELAKE